MLRVSVNTASAQFSHVFVNSGLCLGGRWSSRLWSSWAWRTTIAAAAVEMKAVGGGLRWGDVYILNVFN